jgi:hypothetical protein
MRLRREARSYWVVITHDEEPRQERLSFLYLLGGLPLRELYGEMSSSMAANAYRWPLVQAARSRAGSGSA